MSAFSKVGNFFKTIGHTAYAVLSKVFGPAAVDAFEKSVETILRDDVVVIFADAVQAAESLNTDSAGKRAAAFAQVTSDLKAQGTTLAGSVINLGIEMVVQLIKAKAVQVANPPSAS